MAITVSSGDNGYGVQFPAASRYVTAVGGTTLNQVTNAGSRSATETAWSGAGSGCSAYELKPTWQVDHGCTSRTVADVAAVADPNTGVWVRHNGAWYIFGGTSVASPIMASVYALAGSSRATSADPAAYPYADASGLFDISIGSNGSCGGSYLCTGAIAYDGPTGLGTPNGPAAFGTVGVQPDFTVTASPGALTIPKGGTGTSTIMLAPVNGYSSPVALSLVNAPRGVVATFAFPSVALPNQTTSALTLTLGQSTKPGTQTLTVTAKGPDGMIRTTSLVLTVQ